MTLQKFAKKDFKVLQDWSTDQDILWQFAGPNLAFPLSELDMQYFLLESSKGFAFSLFLDSEASQMVGFGQILNFAGDASRLGRLIIHPELRNQGFGRILINLLIEKTISLYPSIECIDLYVADSNTSARACYESVGFDYLTDKHVDITFGDQLQRLLRMRKNLG
ncbi:MAG: GNAT family N-acetyltransferase [Saprospiraceae bacterium]